MRNSYLFQYFETYPNRSVTEEELLNEAMPGLVNREELSEMIEQGLADGWLASTTDNNIVYYHLKEYGNE